MPWLSPAPPPARKGLGRGWASASGPGRTCTGGASPLSLPQSGLLHVSLHPDTSFALNSFSQDWHSVSRPALARGPLWLLCPISGNPGIVPSGRRYTGVHSPVSFSHAEKCWATVPFPGATQCDWGSEEGHASLLQRSRAHCHVLGTLLVPQISSLVQSGFCIFLAPESPWEQDSGW